MPIWIIIKKVIKVKCLTWKLKRVKLNAYRESQGLPPRYNCFEYILRGIWKIIIFLLLRTFCFCLFCTRDQYGRTLWERFWTDGTLPNAIAKSFLGLIVGLFFTHLITVFLIFQLNFDPVSTTYYAIFGGVILTLGLALSETIRCFMFLTVPQFFTKKGRAAMLGYCLILAISGPGKNATKNMEILTESLLCTQEMAQNATQGLIDLVRNPRNALGNALKSMSDAVTDAADSIIKGLKVLLEVIKSVVNTIKNVISWLKQITSFCNDRVGSPSVKCKAAFDEAITDCKYKLGKTLGWMCSVVDVAKHLCTLAKWGEDFMCWFPNLIKEHIFEPIKKGLKDVGAAIKTFFDVRIKFDYQLEGSFTSSKSFRNVVRGMKAEILEEIHWLTQYMDWVDLLASLFLILALYKALIYRRRFLNVDSFDNFYISKGIVKLDLRRKRTGRDGIFPLKYGESFSFVHPFSLVLVESERKAMKQQLTFVGIAALKILIYVFIDYVFYLFLLIVQKYGAFHVDTRQLLGHGVKIQGDGFLAAMYRALLLALSPIGALLPIYDTSPCLPIPSPPNYYRYAMIFSIILVCFIACLTEPYGMRLRHVICGLYYPHRILPRERWLYTHIIAIRGNFITFARSELQSRMGKTGYRVGLIQRLTHMFPCLRRILSLLRIQRKKCFLCGLDGDIDDTENFFHCPNCNSVYCSSCLEDAGGRCVACLSPIEFGDISEELGSDSSDDNSDDEEAIKMVLKARKGDKQSAFSESSSSTDPSIDSGKFNKLPVYSDEEEESDSEDEDGEESLHTFEKTKSKHVFKDDSEEEEDEYVDFGESESQQIRERSELKDEADEEEDGEQDSLIRWSDSDTDESDEEEQESTDESKFKELFKRSTENKIKVITPIKDEETLITTGREEIQSQDESETATTIEVDKTSQIESDELSQEGEATQEEEIETLQEEDETSQEEEDEKRQEEEDETSQEEDETSQKEEDETSQKEEDETNQEEDDETNQDEASEEEDDDKTIQEEEDGTSQEKGDETIQEEDETSEEEDETEEEKSTQKEEDETTQQDETSQEEEDERSEEENETTQEEDETEEDKSTQNEEEEDETTQEDERETLEDGGETAEQEETTEYESRSTTENEEATTDEETTSDSTTSSEFEGTQEKRNVTFSSYETENESTKSSSSDEIGMNEIEKIPEIPDRDTGDVDFAERDISPSLPMENIPSPLTRDKCASNAPRKCVNPSLAERIAMLDEFYSKMPYPPSANICTFDFEKRQGESSSSDSSEDDNSESSNNEDEENDQRESDETASTDEVEDEGSENSNNEEDTQAESNIISSSDESENRGSESSSNEDGVQGESTTTSNESDDEISESSNNEADCKDFLKSNQNIGGNIGNISPPRISNENKLSQLSSRKPASNAPRKCVNPSLADRVAILNNFYSKIHPPNC